MAPEPSSAADAGARPAQRRRPTLAISMGDPLGIGPEVLVRALSDRAVRSRARHVIFGTGSAMDAAARLVGVEPFWWRVGLSESLRRAAISHDVVLVDLEAGADAPDPLEPPASRNPGRPTKRGGALSFAFVESAIDAAKRPEADELRADAVVTAPISKEAWAMAGRGKYPGHTELLAARFNAKRTRMMFVAPRLNVVLATAHLPLMEIRNVLTIGRVEETIDLAHAAVRELGVERPRLAVAGLNPHAGEAGLLGDEETRVIEPAVRLALQHGMDVAGPLPGDTVFNAAVSGRYDAVVAMYHDQGLIPVKLLAFDEAVNLTIGLPTVRTSPDHGTAFGIAGRGEANPGSMTRALALAADLATRRRAEHAAAAPA